MRTGSRSEIATHGGTAMKTRRRMIPPPRPRDKRCCATTATIASARPRTGGSASCRRRWTRRCWRGSFRCRTVDDRLPAGVCVCISCGVARRDPRPVNPARPPLRCRTFFCGCRSACKEFLIVGTCDRVRSFVRPVQCGRHGAAGRDGDTRTGAKSPRASSRLGERFWFARPGSFRSCAHSDHAFLTTRWPQLCPPPDQAPISTGPR